MHDKNIQPPPNSRNVILRGSLLFTNVLFKIENIAARKAENKPTHKPSVISLGNVPATKAIAGTMTNPSATSYHFTLVFNIIGSKRDAKNDVVAIQINVTEAFDNFTAP